VRRVLVPLVALALPALAGCTVTVGRLGVATTRQVDASPASAVPARGRDCLHLVTIVPIEWPPDLGVALDRALDAAGRRTLSDVVVRYRFFYVPFVYGEACYEVEGRAS
jgi:hypothetical protein